MALARTPREHDLLGERDIPANAYYGVHTLRALEDFPITGAAISIYTDLVHALACVKQAAAIANNELGLLHVERAMANVSTISWSMSFRAALAPPPIVNANEVIGNDVTVSFAAEAGQLQLNAFEPIIAHSLFKSLTHLKNG